MSHRNSILLMWELVPIRNSRWCVRKWGRKLVNVTKRKVNNTLERCLICEHFCRSRIRFKSAIIYLTMETTTPTIPRYITTPSKSFFLLLFSLRVPQKWHIVLLYRACLSAFCLVRVNAHKIIWQLAAVTCQESSQCISKGKEEDCKLAILDGNTAEFQMYIKNLLFIHFLQCIMKDGWASLKCVVANTGKKLLSDLRTIFAVWTSAD